MLLEVRTALHKPMSWCPSNAAVTMRVNWADICSSQRLDQSPCLTIWVKVTWECLQSSARSESLALPIRVLIYCLVVQHNYDVQFEAASSLSTGFGFPDVSPACLRWGQWKDGGDVGTEASRRISARNLNFLLHRKQEASWCLLIQWRLDWFTLSVNVCRFKIQLLHFWLQLNNLWQVVTRLGNIPYPFCHLPPRSIAVQVLFTFICAFKLTWCFC